MLEQFFPIKDPVLIFAALMSIALLAQDLIDKKEVNVIGRICGICRQLREGGDGCAGPAPERCGS